MTAITVDEYLAAAPQPHRRTLEQLRKTLRSLLPDAEETISYNVPAFKVNGEAVAGYAFFKNHCSYFPHSGSVFPAVAEALSGYEWSKGALRFAPETPLPEELVRRLVEVRLAQLGR